MAKRRQEILLDPFPELWANILDKNIPLYRRLPDLLQQSLRHKIQIFLSEKHFEGCGGLVITDEIMVTIAAQACMLILSQSDTDPVYGKLKSIIVYPGAYYERKALIFPSMSKSRKSQIRLGESWTSGSVVLAWDSVQRGGWDIKDGHNVVLHEFAHQLDQADGVSDGAPILKEKAQYTSWAKVFSREFSVHVKRSSAGRYTLMDKYGATNPAEFFAVATENFFEKPTKMKLRHSELYQELSNFYGFDPAEWFEIKKNS